MRSFDHVALGTRIFRVDNPNKIYSVSDLGTKIVAGAEVTQLVVQGLGSDGYNDGSRKRKILNTDRANWSQV